LRDSSGGGGAREVGGTSGIRSDSVQEEASVINFNMMAMFWNIFGSYVTIPESTPGMVSHAGSG